MCYIMNNNTPFSSSGVDLLQEICNNAIFTATYHFNAAVHIIEGKTLQLVKSGNILYQGPESNILDRAGDHDVIAFLHA